MRYLLVFFALVSVSWTDMFPYYGASVWYDWDGELYIKYNKHVYYVLGVEHDIYRCECMDEKEIDLLVQ